MEFKKYPHNPPHLFIDGAIYFITGGILDKRLLLHDDEHKEIVRAAMEKWFAHFQWHLDAWIILGNHYHLMAKAKLAKDMPTIIGRMHGGSATIYRRTMLITATNAKAFDSEVILFTIATRKRCTPKLMANPSLGSEGSRFAFDLQASCPQ